MCGITGIASFAESSLAESRSSESQEALGLERLRAMVEPLTHRGPDEEGMGVRQGVALGMRRLSIIDLEGGSQPIANEDGSVRVVFNGEIYNYRELRGELAARGHVFATESDTEVIVHAYEEYGADFARRLNGMFAIALHDLRRRAVLLARDPIGVKPLYYSFTGDHLVWGSEIKSILASGLVERELDLDALGAFMAWEYVPAPATLFRSIRKLEPGTLLEVDLREAPGQSQREPRAYWDLEPAARRNGHAENGRAENGRAERGLLDIEWEERVDAQLRRSTRRQMVSDVPLGAFLSGGVDSSLIVSKMNAPEAEKRPKTFSIGFDNPSYNELGWAKKVADHLGVPHVQETIEPDVLELFPRLMEFMDDPIGDFSIFPTYLVARLAREHVTVVLSGDGGDEIFGGYETYVAQNVANLYERLPSLMRKGLIEPAARALRPRPAKKGLVNKSRRFVEGIRHPEALQHARWRLFAGEDLLGDLFTPEAQAKRTTRATRHVERLFEEAKDFSPVNRMLYVDLKSYLSDNILTKVDRMSMATSLEARVPFLDTDLVELAFRVPDRLKVEGRKTKVLLKRLAARYVPEECAYRPKEGFSIPIKNWLRTQFRPMLERYLDEEAIEAQGIFRGEAVARLKNEHLAGADNHSHVLWSLMVFQAWYERWFEGAHVPLVQNEAP